MGSSPPNLTGVHYCAKVLSKGRTRWYVYAWRGGPRIMVTDGKAKPALTAEAIEEYRKAHQDRHQPRRDNFSGLVTAYLSSPEYHRLADSTRLQWRRWIDRARAEFGTAPLRIFSSPKMRGAILEWRDQWAEAPRSADYAIQVLSRVLSWGVQRGWIMHNPAQGAPTLYRNDRSDIVWTDEEIEAISEHLLPHVARAFKLAAWTGLPRGDLVSLRWDQIHSDYIGGERGKTGVERCIPLFDETRALLADCPRSAVTVITNIHGRPFTARGFAAKIETARRETGIAANKTLHDLRGTFATRLMSRGFEDREIDEILAWKPGKSARIRRRYISRSAIVRSAIERMRRA